MGSYCKEELHGVQSCHILFIMNRYKDHVRVRKLKSTLLLDWQRELANHLDFAIWVLPDVPLPSENYLKKFRKYLTGLQIEKQKRADFILQKHFEITDIMRT